eukprot:367784-Pelagomonas_calceolata.AAC.1
MAVRSIAVSNSAPSGNKLVGILYSIGMKSVCKFNGTLVVKSRSYSGDMSGLQVMGRTSSFLIST